MTTGLYKKGLVLGIIVLFVGIGIVPGSSIKDRNRDYIVFSTADSGNGTLRQCMLNATSGDTIYFDTAVFPPGSPATITISSSLPQINQGDLTIDASNAGVILNGSGTPGGTHGFHITSDGNTIKGMQILNFPDATGIYIYNAASNNIVTGNNASNNYYGIRLYSSSNNNTITGNNASNNNHGIYLSYSSDNNTITGNNITSNKWYGISLYSSSDNNIIMGNNISSNNNHGIYLTKSSDNNIIMGNNISSNNDNGIALQSSSNSTITGNNISNNYYGIGLSSSSDNNIIMGNNISSNNYYGIHLSSSSDNTITGNTASNNNNGISLLFSCNNNTITGNNANSNNNNGISLLSSSNNTVTGNNANSNNNNGISLSSQQPTSSNNNIHHNNLINNVLNAHDGGNNQWDNNYPSGGNYWDDYTGTDADGDGIGDTSYPIPGGTNEDRYPLMEPFIVSAPDIDGPTSGTAGESYEYTFVSTDPNGDNVKYYIDWGDGDTEWTGFSASGTPVTVSHTWAEKDTYTIAAKAKDEYGLESDWATLEVSMPKNKAINLFWLLLERLMERFPIMEQILQLVYDKLTGF